MKKIIMAIALGAAGIGAAFAAQPAANTDQTTCPAATECPAQTDCRGADKKCSAFDGLDLTADQQAKLDDLRKSCQAKRDQARADRKQDKADRRQARQDDRRDMLAKIKEILTPEQYVKFLENSFVDNGGAPKGNKARGHMAQSRRGAPDKAKAHHDRRSDSRRK